MSSSNELYNRLNEKLRELVSVKNGKQVSNWIWVVVGILQSQSCNLSQIANYLPMPSKAESRVTLIRRWLMNPHVKVWMFYQKVLEHVLSGWSEVEAFIILDGVMVFGDRWQIFRVSLQHGCRAIPIAWTIVEGKGLGKVAIDQAHVFGMLLRDHIQRVVVTFEALEVVVDHDGDGRVGGAFAPLARADGGEERVRAGDGRRFGGDRAAWRLGGRGRGGGLQRRGRRGCHRGAGAEEGKKQKEGKGFTQIHHILPPGKTPKA